MKKHKLIIPFVAVAISLSGTGAMASPGHGGHHSTPNHHTIVHLNNAPRPGHSGMHHNHHVVHNKPHHYHHHHGASAGDLIIATAILVSALM